MTALATPPKLQFLDSNGAPLVGGKLYTYAAGTTTPQVTYTDFGGGTPNANPVILDSRGEASVWLGTALYKMALYSAADVLIWTVDNIGGFATLAQLAASGGSSLVGYLPAGTGAVATTVQTKLRESVSILDFGAHSIDEPGYESFDSTPAILAALAASSSIYVPRGVYLCDSIAPINIAFKTIYGEASGRLGGGAVAPENLSVIRARSASAVFWDVVGGHHFTMKNIMLDGNGISDTVYRLKVGTTRHYYENCQFYNATPTTGITCILGDAENIQVDMTMFVNCVFTTNTASFGVPNTQLKIIGTNTISLNFYMCRFGGSTSTSVYLLGGPNLLTFDTCECNSFADTMFYVAGTAGFEMRNWYSESPIGSTAVRIADSVYSTRPLIMVIESCVFQGDGLKDIRVGSNIPTYIRNNRCKTITVDAPTTPSLAYSVEITGNRLGTGSVITDNSNRAKQSGNTEQTAGALSNRNPTYIGGSYSFTPASPAVRPYSLALEDKTVFTQALQFYYHTGNVNGPAGAIGSVNSSTSLRISGGGYISNDFSIGVADNFTPTSSSCALLDVAPTLKFYSKTGLTAGTAIDLPGSAGALKFSVSTAGHVLPGTTATQNLGSATFEWNNIYLEVAPIVSSDARIKTSVSNLSVDELNAAQQLLREVGTYKLLSAIASKGADARKHIGMTVQRAIEIMESNNLNAFEYGFICHDVWDAEYVEHEAVIAVKACDAVIGEDGNELSPKIDAVKARDAYRTLVHPAGDKFSFRYEELNIFMLRGLEERLSIIEQSIAK
jgi:hypothetical protein